MIKTYVNIELYMESGAFDKHQEITPKELLKILLGDKKFDIVEVKTLRYGKSASGQSNHDTFTLKESQRW